MLKKTYYCEYERIKDNKVLGKSFRVETIWFWECIQNMIEIQLAEIEAKFNCNAYLSNIKRID